MSTGRSMKVRQRCVLASGNHHKAREMESILASLSLPLEVVPASALNISMDVEEDGKTFARNARIKADFLWNKIEGKFPVLADDSGLEVDALEGRPGVRSARFAGENASDLENLTKLIKEMEPFPSPGDRTASFVCSLVWIGAGDEVVSVEGRSPGRIASAPAGRGGFGYDPIFVPSGYAVSFAELDPGIKDQRSHRAIALKLFAPLIFTN